MYFYGGDAKDCIRNPTQFTYDSIKEVINISFIYSPGIYVESICRSRVFVIVYHCCD